MPSKPDAKAWVNDYGDMLYRYALARVKDEAIAKDLVQETFLAAWRNYDNFKGATSGKNWLYAILKNKIIDHFRQASTRLTDRLLNSGEEDSYFDQNGHWAAATSPRQWQPGGDQSLENKEFYSILLKCKKALKKIQDMVFTLRYLEDMDSEEICKVLDITPSNYWVLIHRAKLQLRSCLEKNWFLK